MNQNDKDKGALKVTIMGLGLNGGGLASALYFASRGAQVTVTDLRDENVLAPSIEALNGYPIRYVLGRHELEDFSSADLVIKNPGVRPDNSYLAVAKKVDSDISIFLRQCPCPIIAVTGSKGKSSTASAIHHILQQAGRQSYLGGNITVSPLSFLPELGTDDIVVLELSSWQLGDLQDRSVLKPHCAVLTHIVPDHLYRYGTMERYLAYKRIIYQHQDQSCWTICEDDHWGNSFAAETGGRVLQYSSTKPATGAGAWLEADGSGLALLPDLKAEQTTLAQKVMLPENLRVPGKHNRMNCLAAGLAAWTLGLDPETIQAGLATFPGVAHRLEFFAERQGVRWYNDSAATVPEAVEAAVTAFNEPLVLITGGTDKVLDFTPSRRACARAQQVILLAGSGTEKLRPMLEADGIAYTGPFDKLPEAVAAARNAATAGSIVILSPGCTSFGMFKNEFDRGNSFKQTVTALYANG